MPVKCMSDTLGFEWSHVRLWRTSRFIKAKVLENTIYCRFVCNMLIFSSFTRATNYMFERPGVLWTSLIFSTCSGPSNLWPSWSTLKDFYTLEMNLADFDDLPLSIPPPGVTLNMTHPPSRALEADIGLGICLGIACIFVMLRIYVKLVVTHKWDWDDCKFSWPNREFNINNRRGLFDGICKKFLPFELLRWSDRIDARPCSFHGISWPSSVSHRTPVAFFRQRRKYTG